MKYSRIYETFASSSNPKIICKIHYNILENSWFSTYDTGKSEYQRGIWSENYKPNHQAKICILTPKTNYIDSKS